MRPSLVVSSDLSGLFQFISEGSSADNINTNHTQDRITIKRKTKVSRYRVQDTRHNAARQNTASRGSLVSSISWDEKRESFESPQEPFEQPFERSY